MAKRITIMLDDDLNEKLRIRQAKKIQDVNGTCSFSSMVNEILRKGLRS